MGRVGGGGGVRVARWRSRGLGHVTWQSALMRGWFGTRTDSLRVNVGGTEGWGFVGAEMVRPVLLPRLLD